MSEPGTIKETSEYSQQDLFFCFFGCLCSKNRELAEEVGRYLAKTREESDRQISEELDREIERHLNDSKRTD